MLYCQINPSEVGMVLDAIGGHNDRALDDKTIFEIAKGNPIVVQVLIHFKLKGKTTVGQVWSTLVMR